jgi:Tfp pilus assembly protein PilF
MGSSGLRVEFWDGNSAEAAKLAITLGLLHRAAEDAHWTVHHYQEAVGLNPGNNWAHNNLGTAYLELGKADKAIAEYTRALQIDPKDSKAHNNLGLAFLRQGKLDPAAAEFERALRENPHFPEAETNLGRVFVRSGRRFSSRPLGLRRSLRPRAASASGIDNPKRALAEQGYRPGSRLSSRGDARQATAHFEQALKIDPEYEAARTDLATLRHRPPRLGR